MDKKLMNKMDGMEMDKVSGGARGNRGNDVKKEPFPHFTEACKMRTQILWPQMQM